MIELIGSHGTSKEKAEQICSTGFKCHKGRLGSGAYFWGDEDYLAELASAWANYRFKDEDKSFFIVKIKTEEDNILEIDKDFKLGIIKIFERRSLRLNFNKFDDISRAYGILISELEKQLNTKYQVVTGLVPFPQREYLSKSVPVKVLGQATCYAVRDSGIVEIIDEVSA